MCSGLNTTKILFPQKIGNFGNFSAVAIGSIDVCLVTYLKYQSHLGYK
jgi:hypothetical protein